MPRLTRGALIAKHNAGLGTCHISAADTVHDRPHWLRVPTAVQTWPLGWLRSFSNQHHTTNIQQGRNTGYLFLAVTSYGLSGKRSLVRSTIASMMGFFCWCLVLERFRFTVQQPLITTLKLAANEVTLDWYDNSISGNEILNEIFFCSSQLGTTIK